MTPTQIKLDELDKAVLEEIRPHAQKVKTWMSFTGITSIILLSIAALIILIVGIIALVSGTPAAAAVFIYLISIGFGFVLAVYMIQMGRGAIPFLETGDLAAFDQYDAGCRLFFKRWGILFFIQLGVGLLGAIIALIVGFSSMPSLYNLY
ncbi:hypothetical protein GF359_07580 [candidate division WOR-3 bacterium]|uniref:DUF5362 domain-containing protein n=1 Tax=candidate division WOR-3 bacterium TaxID=2052148 RepID=A0A9D5KC87_UNCW3|nr:hypothetical protein [candidate division WOR-3 bacterium]MBD3365061.1 hypothetical protein [candidate division WOR-3 bacterium]